MRSDANFLEEFLDFEVENELFDVQVNGIFIWERIRHVVWLLIRYPEQSHTTPQGSIVNDAKALYLLLRSTFKRNPYLSGKHDVAFFGTPRRKKEADGYWWDIYCDPIHTSCDFDYIHFEEPRLRTHKQPARTGNLRYLDPITYGWKIQKRLRLKEPPSIPPSTEKILEMSENDLKERFNTSIDLNKLVYRNLYERFTKQWMYQCLIKRVDPEIVVIVCSWGLETLVEACKNQNVPVVELQHGVIHRQHMGYNYPGNRTKEMFPDYLFVWGDFWKDSVDYPIPDDRVISVGFPYLEQTVDRYSEVESRNQILFISQEVIGEQLSKFAIEVNQYSEIEHDIIFKLHPSEYDQWRDKYPWLVDSDIQIVDSSKPHLYRLLSESSVQVGVCSTAIYEGLYFNLETYLFDCIGVEIMQGLLDEGTATLVSSVEDFRKYLGQTSNGFDREQFFKSNAAGNVCETITRIGSK